MLNFAEGELGKCLTCGWMHNVLFQRTDHVYRPIVPPQEKLCLVIPQLVLDKYLALIKEYIPLVSTELIFDIDVFGFSDWEESKSKSAVIWTDIRNLTFLYRVNRGIRHQTLICCITATRDAYCPLLVSFDPTMRQVFYQGLHEGIELRVEITLSPYANAEIFGQHFDTVSIPVFVPNRQIERYQIKRAILFCNNSAARCLNDVLIKLAYH
jgi:hypothetical protein